VAELACGELGAHAPKEVNELGTFEAPFDVERTKFEDLGSAIECLSLDDPGIDGSVV
jgi:hypothetical protein